MTRPRSIKSLIPYRVREITAWIITGAIKLGCLLAFLLYLGLAARFSYEVMGGAYTVVAFVFSISFGIYVNGCIQGLLNDYLKDDLEI